MLCGDVAVGVFQEDPNIGEKGVIDHHLFSFVIIIIRIIVVIFVIVISLLFLFLLFEFSL